MTLRLNASDPGFDRDFDHFINANRGGNNDVAGDVTRIIAKVRARGDDALTEYTNRFDGHSLAASGWNIEAAECRAAYDALDSELRAALDMAAERIRAYHEAQLPEDRDYRDAQNVRLGARWSTVEAAGLYVPGGRAAYPSSLLMNAIPAKVAGVERLVVTTPTPNGEINPLVLAAAHLAGVDEIWRIGGAQAVAALAHGTDKIASVDVITGPGNAWVAEAKRQLYGVVGIDMVAGPSEIVVVADAQNDPEWIAADLLSQSEHDPSSQSILFTDDASFANLVADAVALQLNALPTSEVARQSWSNNGAIIVVDDLKNAMPLCDRLAPEHLELATDNAEQLFAMVRHAGSVFLGRNTPEAIGDYVAGPNHVLPTGQRARFSSGLSVLDFMKRTSFIELDHDSLGAIGPAAMTLAKAEGLPAHAESVRRRLEEKK
ncbi:histidinol dehydrogenase [Sphingorhabdus sp. Alg239-R122]|uniref:histidinol dehydrogenase n=1 Tax=Sphingorhabdus sp. Alg239-R122 TaxID=2305989 RepID=UPI0013DC0110|nr:histidinol dehydrogenase [Sphingorhabdus sp. Alg239-R122]